MYLERVIHGTHSASPTSQRRRWRWVAMLAFGSTLIPSSGCTAWTGVQQSWQYNGYFNESMIGLRHSSLASKAWHSRKHCHSHERYMKEFSRGFKAGYMSVAGGGDGCTPSHAPREYWGWQYQSAEGQTRVASWFAGFPQGVHAAEQDGVGGWTQIQTSAGIQNQYVEHGRMPAEYAGMYPVPPIQPGMMAQPPLGIPSSEIIDSEVIEFEDPSMPNGQPFGLGSPASPLVDPSIQ